MEKELLNILVCPKDRKKLALSGSKLTCSKCKKAYPVKEGIPIFV